MINGIVWNLKVFVWLRKENNEEIVYGIIENFVSCLFGRGLIFRLEKLK